MQTLLCDKKGHYINSQILAYMGIVRVHLGHSSYI